ncbi:MAG: hypothetical protein K2O55_07155, partial [Alistipes sp.]|nr:hypothetical protein [Alistipes sp.]
LLLATAAGMSLTGCSKNEEGSNPLSGTTWERTADGIQNTLTFNDTECRYILKYSGASANYKTTIYNYTYEEPVVTLVPLEAGLAVVEGIISGSAMTLTNTSTGKEIGVYLRQ